MAAIKSYTDIEQSKALAKILSLESADMSWVSNGLGKPFARTIPIKGDPEELCACWSLAALLGVLEHPRCFQGDKPIYWFCGCFGKDGLYHEVEADNPVNACYKMILELNKSKLL